MAVQYHDIPILEYDDDPSALIRPDKAPQVRFPKRAVFAFLGDFTDDYALAHGAQILDRFVTVGRTTCIYQLDHKGESLCLCRAPLGGAAAVQLMDYLIGHGVEKIIAVGSCGALTRLPENAFLIPQQALRDEGTSYHYLPPSRYVEVAEEISAAIARTLAKQGLTWAYCATWTTDAFFRETEAMVTYRRKEGCDVVEMECASMAACARFRGVSFGQLLYTADSLADAARYDERGWGMDSVAPALILCLEAAASLSE